MRITYWRSTTACNVPLYPNIIMHLSMLSPRVWGGGTTHGKLTRQTFPWVRILTWPPFRSFCFFHPTMSERKVSESVLLSFKYTQSNTSFTQWSFVYKYINCLRFFLFFMIAYVFIFMSTLDIGVSTNANYFRVFVIEVFMQYGEQQKVIVIDDSFHC